MSVIASAIIGNPRTPCSGTGICDMIATNINSELALPLTLDTSGNDLIIGFSTEAMQTLLVCRPDIYQSIRSLDFKFDDTALPFYIDFVLAQKLWPESSHYKWLTADNVSNMKTSYDVENNVYQISIPAITDITNGKYGSTGSFDGPSVFQSGTWHIGCDVYGNLVFKNDVNMVLFGNYPNLSINRFSAQTTGNKIDVPRPDSAGWKIQNWNIFNDEAGNLCFYSGNNLIWFGHDVNSIFVQGMEVATNVSGQSIPDPTFNNQNANEILGDWNIRTDDNGNLSFIGPHTSYYFAGSANDNSGSDSIVFVGENAQVTTHFPKGGNKS